MGAFDSQEDLIAALLAADPLDNETLAARTEGRAPPTSICVDAMHANDSTAGVLVHEAVAQYRGDGGVVLVLVNPDGTHYVRMYSTGEADPVTGGCRLLFESALGDIPTAVPSLDEQWSSQLAQLLPDHPVVVADHAGVLAVDEGQGNWWLINVVTGEAVTVAAVGNVIGVGDLGPDFVIVTSVEGSTTQVSVAVVHPDGAVIPLGMLETPESIGLAAPVRASVATLGDNEYVLVETASNASQSVATPAVLWQGHVQPMETTVYGEMSLGDHGDLVVTRTALTPPAESGVAEDGGGWFLTIGPDAAHGLLVGRLTGQAVVVDRATGAPAGPGVQMFQTDGDLVIAAWPDVTGHYTALVGHGPLCQLDGRNVFGPCDLRLVAAGE